MGDSRVTVDEGREQIKVTKISEQGSGGQGGWENSDPEMTWAGGG